MQNSVTYNITTGENKTSTEVSDNGVAFVQFNTGKPHSTTMTVKDGKLTHLSITDTHEEASRHRTYTLLEGGKYKLGTRGTDATEEVGEAAVLMIPGVRDLVKQTIARIEHAAPQLGISANKAEHDLKTQLRKIALRGYENELQRDTDAKPDQRMHHLEFLVGVLDKEPGKGRMAQLVTAAEMMRKIAMDEPFTGTAAGPKPANMAETVEEETTKPETGSVSPEKLQAKKDYGIAWGLLQPMLAELPTLNELRARADVASARQITMGSRSIIKFSCKFQYYIIILLKTINRNSYEESSNSIQHFVSGILHDIFTKTNQATALILSGTPVVGQMTIDIVNSYDVTFSKITATISDGEIFQGTVQRNQIRVGEPGRVITKNTTGRYANFAGSKGLTMTCDFVVQGNNVSLVDGGGFGGCRISDGRTVNVTVVNAPTIIPVNKSMFDQQVIKNPAQIQIWRGFLHLVLVISHLRGVGGGHDGHRGLRDHLCHHALQNAPAVSSHVHCSGQGLHPFPGQPLSQRV